MLPDIRSRRAAAAVLVLLIASPVAANVDFALVPLDLPSGYANPGSVFSPSSSLQPGKSSWIEAGNTMPCQSSGVPMLSSLGPISGGRLLRKDVLFPEFDRIVGVAPVPGDQPLLIAFGEVIRDSIVSGVETVYGGNPLKLLSSKPTSASGFPGNMVVTRYSNPGDFDVLLDDGALALVPAGPLSGPSVVIVRPTTTLLVDAADRHQLWSQNVGGTTAVGGEIGVDDHPVFVSASSSQLNIYGLDPVGTLLRHLDIEVSDAMIADRDGDGHNEILVADVRGGLRWYDSNGVQIGATVTLPQADGGHIEAGVRTQRIMQGTGPFYHSKLAWGDVTGTQSPEVMVTVSGEHSGTYVLSRDLSSLLKFESLQAGLCGSVRIADLDGDGRTEIVTMVPTPDLAPFAPSSLRIVEADSGSQVFSGSFPASTFPLGRDTYSDFEVYGGGVTKNIVLVGLGGFYNNTVITVINGATRVQSARSTIPSLGMLGATAVRHVSANGSTPEQFIVAGGPGIYALNAQSLQENWSLSQLSPGNSPAVDMEVTTFGAANAPKIVVIINWVGVFVIDLATHAIDANIAAESVAGTVLQSGPSGKIAYFEFSDQCIHVIDASGAEVMSPYCSVRNIAKMRADPANTNRLIVSDNVRLYSLRLDERRIEGVSRKLPDYAPGDSLIATDNGKFAYATSSGVWSVTLLPTETPIFANGFEAF